ncbi:WD40-repeat-containing domain protein, partial [Chytriomyces sp. MP71]
AFRTLLGHTGPIHDLCWSKSQLLLSASTDKTVRLWHTLRAQALRVFTHDAPITGVRFHPQDDACFVSVAGAGPTRSRLRVWDVARGRVARWVDLAADVGFSQDGSLLITGTSDGGLYFHEYVDGELRYNTHLDLKAQANVKAFRVTGVECLGGDAAAVSGDGYVLVTATDSRIRLFNLRDKSL